ncbi:nuclear transport factor 2 family protein [Sphingomonas sp. BIUV-7]|uniref:Nuclear transport factor 2 family protein n=1 Tax=Sphingomonas natans TaxID=3063330 RepID=A0ABT8YAB5_9SPHN|nr:nuclear transport factor 2 family protein [Sphingomonas sp. BIUV-7]MDO6415265.1 nuclear transport factor 2 family protein [Sphingomonas sp. BIUV-7]
MDRRQVLVGAAKAAVLGAAVDAALAEPAGGAAGKSQSATGPDSSQLADLMVIQNLLAGSAWSADVGETAFQTNLYAEDAVMDLGGERGAVRGRAAVVGMIVNDGHKSARADGMTHVAAQPFIRISGDKAVAVGYIQIIVTDPASPERSLAGSPAAHPLITVRMTANRWEFARREGRWQITRRTIRAAPSPEALALLRDD